jgi:hypothetical protein
VRVVWGHEGGLMRLTSVLGFLRAPWGNIPL